MLSLGETIIFIGSLPNEKQKLVTGEEGHFTVYLWGMNFWNIIFMSKKCYGFDQFETSKVAKSILLLGVF